MRVVVAAVAVLLAFAAAAFASPPAPTKTLVRRANDSFVSTKNGRFHLDGKPFNHVSTTAYWLAQLSDADITTVLTAINATGIKVVRTWAFNDVTEIPPNNGTYFQLLANGTAFINDGPTGLQRLDKVIEEADKLGLKVHLTLTNNWSALPNVSVSSVNLPNGFLSNAYGGMDAYVRHFVGENGTHDQFFVNQTLIDAFQNYTTAVVSRYVNSSAIFSYEIANDPRCNSTLATSPDCNPQNITRWVATVSKHIRTIDPNHLVSSGAGGFMCTNCPKLFATPSAPAPSVTPSDGVVGRKRGLMTAAKVLAMRSSLMRKWREDGNRARLAVDAPPEKRSSIRGKWAAPVARRQSNPATQQTAFNGAQGVDSEDINAIEDIGFSTFQLFPDQNQYMGVDSPDVDPVTQAIDAGVQWIQANAQSAASAGKPSALTAFGLVSTNSSQHFVPFNQSSVTIADILNGAVRTIGANDTQVADAYAAWLRAASEAGVSGIGQYQWGQNFNSSSSSPIVTSSPLAPADPSQTTSQLSPDDGYAAFNDELKNVLNVGADQQTALNT